MAEWNSCSQKIEECEKSIEELKKKLKFKPSISTIWTFDNEVGCFAVYIRFCLLPILLLIGLIIWPFEYIFFKKEKPKVLNNIHDFSQNLVVLQKNKTTTISKFEKIWLIPPKYRDEYALTTMFEFVYNREASTWERATDLYNKPWMK